MLAQDLFVAQGYDETTIDDIAAAVSMSRRTFFRYFSSKEDLVHGKYEIRGDRPGEGGYSAIPRKGLSQRKENPMTDHKTGTREEWLAARLELLEAEKQHMRAGDELTRLRQELPWVPIEKEYVFESDDGKKTLAELFDGRSQLPALQGADELALSLGLLPRQRLQV